MSKTERNSAIKPDITRSYSESANCLLKFESKREESLNKLERFFLYYSTGSINKTKLQDDNCRLSIFSKKYLKQQTVIFHRKSDLMINEPIMNQNMLFENSFSDNINNNEAQLITLELNSFFNEAVLLSVGINDDTFINISDTKYDGPAKFNDNIKSLFFAIEVTILKILSAVDKQVIIFRNYRTVDNKYCINQTKRMAKWGLDNNNPNICSCTEFSATILCHKDSEEITNKQQIKTFENLLFHNIIIQNKNKELENLLSSKLDYTSPDSDNINNYGTQSYIDDSLTDMITTSDSSSQLKNGKLNSDKESTRSISNRCKAIIDTYPNKDKYDRCYHESLKENKLNTSKGKINTDNLFESKCLQRINKELKKETSVIKKKERFCVYPIDNKTDRELTKVYAIKHNDVINVNLLDRKIKNKTDYQLNRDGLTKSNEIKDNINSYMTDYRYDKPNMLAQELKELKSVIIKHNITDGKSMENSYEIKENLQLRCKNSTDANKHRGNLDGFIIEDNSGCKCNDNLKLNALTKNRELIKSFLTKNACAKCLSNMVLCDTNDKLSEKVVRKQNSPTQKTLTSKLNKIPIVTISKLESEPLSHADICENFDVEDPLNNEQTLINLKDLEIEDPNIVISENIFEGNVSIEQDGDCKMKSDTLKDVYKSHCKDSCMSQSKDGSISQSKDGCISQSKDGCMSQSKDGCVGHCKDGCMGHCKDDCMNNCKDGCMNHCKDDCMNNCKDDCMNNCKDGCMNHCKDDCQCHCKDGCKGHGKDGCMSHGKDGCMSHGKDGCMSHGKDGCKGYSKDDCIGHGKDGCMSYGKNGCMSHGKDGCMSHGKDGCMSHGKDGCMSHVKYGCMRHGKNGNKKVKLFQNSTNKSENSLHCKYKSTKYSVIQKKKTLKRYKSLSKNLISNLTNDSCASKESLFELPRQLKSLPDESNKLTNSEPNKISKRKKSRKRITKPKPFKHLNRPVVSRKRASKENLFIDFCEGSSRVRPTFCLGQIPEKIRHSTPKRVIEFKIKLAEMKEEAKRLEKIRLEKEARLREENRLKREEEERIKKEKKEAEERLKKEKLLEEQNSKIVKLNSKDNLSITLRKDSTKSTQVSLEDISNIPIRDDTLLTNKIDKISSKQDTNKISKKSSLKHSKPSSRIYSRRAANKKSSSRLTNRSTRSARSENHLLKSKDNRSSVRSENGEYNTKNQEIINTSKLSLLSQKDFRFKNNKLSKVEDKKSLSANYGDKKSPISAKSLENVASFKSIDPTVNHIPSIKSLNPLSLEKKSTENPQHHVSIKDEANHINHHKKSNKISGENTISNIDGSLTQSISEGLDYTVQVDASCQKFYIENDDSMIYSATINDKVQMDSFIQEGLEQYDDMTEGAVTRLKTAKGKTYSYANSSQLKPLYDEGHLNMRKYSELSERRLWKSFSKTFPHGIPIIKKEKKKKKFPKFSSLNRKVTLDVSFEHRKTNQRLNDKLFNLIVKSDECGDFCEVKCNCRNFMQMNKCHKTDLFERFLKTDEISKLTTTLELRKFENVFKKFVIKSVEIFYCNFIETTVVMITKKSSQHSLKSSTKKSKPNQIKRKKSSDIDRSSQNNSTIESGKHIQLVVVHSDDPSGYRCFDSDSETIRAFERVIYERTHSEIIDLSINNCVVDFYKIIEIVELVTMEQIITITEANINLLLESISLSDDYYKIILKDIINLMIDGFDELNLLSVQSSLMIPIESSNDLVALEKDKEIIPPKIVKEGIDLIESTEQFAVYEAKTKDFVNNDHLSIQCIACVEISVNSEQANACSIIEPSVLTSMTLKDNSNDKSLPKYEIEVENELIENFDKKYVKLPIDSKYIHDGKVKKYKNKIDNNDNNEDKLETNCIKTATLDINEKIQNNGSENTNDLQIRDMDFHDETSDLYDVIEILEKLVIEDIIEKMFDSTIESYLLEKSTPNIVTNEDQKIQHYFPEWYVLCEDPSNVESQLLGLFIPKSTLVDKDPMEWLIENNFDSSLFCMEDFLFGYFVEKNSTKREPLEGLFFHKKLLSINDRYDGHFQKRSPTNFDEHCEGYFVEKNLYITDADKHFNDIDSTTAIIEDYHDSMIASNSILNITFDTDPKIALDNTSTGNFSENSDKTTNYRKPKYNSNNCMDTNDTDSLTINKVSNQSNKLSNEICKLDLSRNNLSSFDYLSDEYFPFKFSRKKKTLKKIHKNRNSTKKKNACEDKTKSTNSNLKWKKSKIKHRNLKNPQPHKKSLFTNTEDLKSSEITDNIKINYSSLLFTLTDENDKLFKAKIESNNFFPEALLQIQLIAIDCCWSFEEGQLKRTIIANIPENNEKELFRLSFKSSNFPQEKKSKIYQRDYCDLIDAYSENKYLCNDSIKTNLYENDQLQTVNKIDETSLSVYLNAPKDNKYHSKVNYVIKPVFLEDENSEWERSFLGILKKFITSELVFYLIEKSIEKFCKQQQITKKIQSMKSFAQLFNEDLAISHVLSSYDCTSSSFNFRSKKDLLKTKKMSGKNVENFLYKHKMSEFNNDYLPNKYKCASFRSISDHLLDSFYTNEMKKKYLPLKLSKYDVLIHEASKFTENLIKNIKFKINQKFDKSKKSSSQNYSKYKTLIIKPKILKANVNVNNKFTYRGKFSEIFSEFSLNNNEIQKQELSNEDPLVSLHSESLLDVITITNKSVGDGKENNETRNISQVDSKSKTVTHEEIKIVINQEDEVDVEKNTVCELNRGSGCPLNSLYCESADDDCMSCDIESLYSTEFAENVIYKENIASTSNVEDEVNDQNESLKVQEYLTADEVIANDDELQNNKELVIHSEEIYENEALELHGDSQSSDKILKKIFDFRKAKTSSESTEVESEIFDQNHDVFRDSYSECVMPVQKHKKKKSKSKPLKLIRCDMESSLLNIETKRALRLATPLDHQSKYCLNAPLIAQTQSSTMKHIAGRDPCCRSNNRKLDGSLYQAENYQTSFKSSIQFNRCFDLASKRQILPEYTSISPSSNFSGEFDSKFNQPYLSCNDKSFNRRRDYLSPPQ